LFDPTRGIRFSTYATIWIKGVLSNNHLDETITIPNRERQKWLKIKKSIRSVSASEGNWDKGENVEKSILSCSKISAEEIASQCNLGVNDVKDVIHRMTKARNVISLDYQYRRLSRSGGGHSEQSTLMDTLKNMDEVDFYEQMQLRDDVVRTLARNLSEREGQLMVLRYGLKDGKTRSLNECAEILGMSRSRAQQLAAGCLRKLREADDAKSLEEYLLTIE